MSDHDAQMLREALDAAIADRGRLLDEQFTKCISCDGCCGQCRKCIRIDRDGLRAALQRIVDTDTHGKNVRDEHGSMRPTGTDFCGRCNRNSFHPHAVDCPIALAAALVER